LDSHRDNGHQKDRNIALSLVYLQITMKTLELEG